MCHHANTKTTLTPEGMHYARTDCLDCGKFLRWEKNPATLERGKRNARLIANLSDPGATLSEWERGFIKSLSAIDPCKLSPKQQDKLDAIGKRLSM